MGKLKKAKPTQKSTKDPKQGKLDLVQFKKPRVLKPLKKSETKISLENGSVAKSHKSKKEKIKQKRDNLMKKIDLIKEQKKDELKKKKREKAMFATPSRSAITGDFKTLRDALPSLDELFKLKPSEIKTGVAEYESKEQSKPVRKKDKIKKRKEEFLNRYRSFESLLKDPEYKKNPREAIAFHIRYTKGLES